jgi:hypothetical protein
MMESKRNSGKINRPRTMIMKTDAIMILYKENTLHVCLSLILVYEIVNFVKLN